MWAWASWPFSLRQATPPGPAHPLTRVAAATPAPLGSHPPAGARNEWNVPGAQGGSAGGRGPGAGAGPEPWTPATRAAVGPTWTQGAQGPSAGLPAGPGLEDTADPVGEPLGHFCSEKACPGPSLRLVLCPRAPQVWLTGTVQPALGMASRRAGPDPATSINTGPDAMQSSEAPMPPTATHHPHSCPRNPAVVGRVTQIPMFQTHPHPRLSPSHPGWQERPGSHSRGSSSSPHPLPG